jgi:hypothetical protein
VNELYELIKKTETLSQILPQTLDRLLALELLHKQGNAALQSVKRNVLSTSDTDRCYSSLLALELLHKQGNAALQSVKHSVPSTSDTERCVTVVYSELIQILSYCQRMGSSCLVLWHWWLDFDLAVIINSVMLGPPLWSSGHSSWLQIQRSGFHSQHYQIF